jgi:hypothetical protein
MIVAAGAVTIVLRPYLWWRVGTAEACRAVEVAIYKSSDGNFLFHYQEDSLVAAYIYSPATKKFGIPARIERLRFNSAYIFAEDSPIPVLDIQEDMNIVTENQTLHFTARGCRITADLKNY